jgi:hypothetical protein
MVDAAKATERRVRAQQAKDFLISQIVEEAERENVPLSEVERKMLYFTETEETLPDIYEVNAQFESEYDDSEYEEKIAGLLRNAFRRNREESVEGERRWKQAIADLDKEDHYLLVMVDQSLQSDSDSLQSGSDFWTVVMWSGGIIVCLFATVATWDYLREKGWIPSWIPNIPFTLSIIGVIALWFVVKLAKIGALGEVIKDLFEGVLNSFPFTLIRKRKQG